MANRLANETSPYLLQHADNPVDWYPWSEEALDKAKTEDKPIFLSIGYSACHWCHVMAHESFEDPQIATLLNRDFIPIKVDREERPDLDAIYMAAVTALTGQGGWPMSLFLTPDGRPFYGGTYFPSLPRGGLPSFKQVLQGISHAWQEQRSDVNAASEQVAAHLQKTLRWEASSRPISEEVLEKAVKTLIDTYDWQNGGWGSAPKFPQAMAIDFLLDQASRGNADALKIARHTLDAMAAGGMYDLVGGGFHRYSTDARWLVPHFEKMLYDNALLALAYLHAFLLTGHEMYRLVCEQTLDFIARDLSGPEGQFFSSLDADTQGGEGATYLWSPEDIHSAIPDRPLADLVISAFGVSPEGNFDGRNILRRVADTETLARQMAIPAEQVDKLLSEAQKLLLAYRQIRPQPGRDEKALTSWNSLALRAFAEAAGSLKRQDYMQIARRNADFILTHLDTSEGLMHTWGRGHARFPAFLEDVSASILGLLGLYELDPDLRWYSAIKKFADHLLRSFSDPSGGFFDTPATQQTPIIRPKENQDNATPSGNALAAGALLRLSALTGYAQWADMAVAAIGSIQDLAARYPTAFGFWLQDLDYALGPSVEIAIVGPPGQARQILSDTVFSIYNPRRVVAVSPEPPDAQAPALLEGRSSIHGQPAAYVCRHFACRLPVTSPEALKRELENLAEPG